ncbi:MAG: hypothetical protein DSY84_03510 [Candidatus Neomarinimicrobiota bacterium]|nr:MAG: hypothetical protein DSY84_03510 [Candidatus Neomarinimicrobiota bacterium]
MAQSLRDQHLRARTVRLKIRTGSFLTMNRSRTLDAPFQDPGRLDPHPPKHDRHDTVRLLDEGQQEMLRLDLRMMRPLGELLRRQDPLLRLLRVACEIHDDAPWSGSGATTPGSVSRPSSAS